MLPFCFPQKVNCFFSGLFNTFIIKLFPGQNEKRTGEELKRDVEKEPILTTSVSNFIQTALYAFGAVSYLIAVINLLYAGISEKSFVYWENGSRFAYNIIFFFSYCMIFIAMALGVWYSVRNELSSKRTGIIMSAEFLKIVYFFSEHI